jgi:hypothetical protein
MIKSLRFLWRSPIPTPDGLSESGGDPPENAENVKPEDFPEA